MKKPTTLFSRLMFSVAMPEIIIFSIVAMISYFQLKELFHEISNEKIENFQDELMSIIKFQDVSFSQISHSIDHSAAEKMRRIRYNYFSSSDSIETADLNRIKKEIGMNMKTDVYIINRQGIVVNSSYKEDLGLDLYQFGEDFKGFLEDMFTHDFYSPQPMTFETTTGRFKKYVYQSSKDHQYIIQLGYYSSGADKFVSEIPRRLKEIVDAQNDIILIDLILAPWDPISFYSKKDLDSLEKKTVQRVFASKKDLFVEKSEKTTAYIFFDRDDIEIIQSGILKVVYDKKRNTQILTLNLLHKVSLFGLGVGILFLILYMNVKTVVKPIHKLSNTARKLGDGLLNERAIPEGSREIKYLAQSFNKMAENLEISHKEITKKNDEILASINYAKRIQEAILPPIDIVQKKLNDVFIYYQPKDIVAGDFYWFETVGDEIFIAAADCTGHGVPGAMVSVVCSNALNKAVKELDLSAPAEILNMTRKLVIETFEKSQHDVKDGMDICFCKINIKSGVVVFSGAQNSLYRTTGKTGGANDEKRIENENDMLVEYKGNKQPIGKFAFEKDFTQTEFICDKGDCLYLITDGFPDQFGGPEGRKFMYKPFKKLLLSLKEKPMEEQHEIVKKAFEDWRGGLDQIDDVCIIGIKI